MKKLERLIMLNNGKIEITLKGQVYQYIEVEVMPIGLPVLLKGSRCGELFIEEEVMKNAPKNADAYADGNETNIKISINSQREISEHFIDNIYREARFCPVQYYKIINKKE